MKIEHFFENFGLKKIPRLFAKYHLLNSKYHRVYYIFLKKILKFYFLNSTCLHERAS